MSREGNEFFKIIATVAVPISHLLLSVPCLCVQIAGQPNLLADACHNA